MPVVLARLTDVAPGARVFILTMYGEHTTPPPPAQHMLEMTAVEFERAYHYRRETAPEGLIWVYVHSDNVLPRPPQPPRPRFYATTLDRVCRRRVVAFFGAESVEWLANNVIPQGMLSQWVWTTAGSHTYGRLNGACIVDREDRRGEP